MAVFFGLHFIDTILGFSVFGETITGWFAWYTSAGEWLVKWTGKNILHLGSPITVLPNGSGDTTFNYVQLFLYLVFSVSFAVIWIFADRKHQSYRRLAYWLRVLMRYHLGYMLLVYGFIKVIKLQFPFPDLTRLIQPYGESSPMGLAWTFIGYSEGYNIFIGSAEVLAGIFLFFKRTTLIGALLSIIVMGNVAAMNFAYDIPVKIFSVMLVSFGVYLASYDWHRLKNMFFLNEPAQAASLAMPRPARWKWILQLSLKIIFLVFAFFTTFYSSWTGRTDYGDQAPKPPLYGIYTISDFVIGKDTLLPLTTDTLRWKKLLISSDTYAAIQNMGDSLTWMKIKIDTTRKTVTLTNTKDSTLMYDLSYQLPDKEHLVFAGKFRGDTALINTEKFELSRFKLVSRGFNWVNEFPYNK
ncbi:MAG: hypothetical protein ABW036_05130 [Flavitalea sp.]